MSVFYYFGFYAFVQMSIRLSVVFLTADKELSNQINYLYKQKAQIIHIHIENELYAPSVTHIFLCNIGFIISELFK